LSKKNARAKSLSPVRKRKGMGKQSAPEGRGEKEQKHLQRGAFASGNEFWEN